MGNEDKNVRIIDLLKKESIEIDCKATSKVEAIDKLVDLMDKSKNLNYKEQYKEVILARELLSSTQICNGIAVPHAKTIAVRSVGLSAIVIKNGMKYTSQNDDEVQLIFMIAVPNSDTNIHVKALERLARMLLNKEFKNELINAKSKEEFLEIIDYNETLEIEKEKIREGALSKYSVLAVVACPTGMVHTFMAAEVIKSKAKEMGINIKVETIGLGGSENPLLKEEIEIAESIIIVANKVIDKERFAGKRVIESRVSEGIYNPEALIRKAIGNRKLAYSILKKRQTMLAAIGKENMCIPMYESIINSISKKIPFIMH